MEKEVLETLNNNQISNDLSFLYWIYSVENKIVNNKRYLRLFLFNRIFNNKKLNKITILFKDKEFETNNFSVISKYKNQDIVGCNILIPMEYDGLTVEIKQEIVDGNIYNSSNNKVLYSKGAFPKENNYLIGKNNSYKIHHDVYPQITDKYWQCSCGRIHGLDTLNCDCGLSQDNAREIIDFNFEESHINDAIKSGITYDLSKTFNENIDAFKNKFTSKFKDCDVEKLISRINLEDEENKYDQLVAELASKKKKRKKRIKITAVITFLLVTGIACFCYFVQDSKEKSFNYYKSYIKDLYAKQEYSEIFTSVTKEGKKYCFVDSWVDIKDEEIMEIFEESAYEKAKEKKDVISTLNTVESALKEIDSKYLDDVREWKDDYYISRISTQPYLSAVDYFYDRYKETNNQKYYEYFIKQLHYYISENYPDGIDDSSFEIRYDDSGFESLDEFLEKLDEYFPLLVDDQCYDKFRLIGYWSGDGYYFKMQGDGDIYYNLPWFDYGDYYSLKKHVISLYKNDDIYQTNGRDLFKITFISSDCIRVYCYDDGSSHTLYKS